MAKSHYPTHFWALLEKLRHSNLLAHESPFKPRGLGQLPCDTMCGLVSLRTGPHETITGKEDGNVMLRSSTPGLIFENQIGQKFQ